MYFWKLSQLSLGMFWLCNMQKCLGAYVVFYTLQIRLCILFLPALF